MKRTFFDLIPRGGLQIVSFAIVTASVAQAASEISAVEKRRVVVDAAARLAKPAPVESLPENLALPFSPPGFDLTDPQEQAAAAAAANGSGKAVTGQKGISDREILEELASKL